MDLMERYASVAEVRTKVSAAKSGRTKANTRPPSLWRSYWWLSVAPSAWSCAWKRVLSIFPW